MASGEHMSSPYLIDSAQDVGFSPKAVWIPVLGYRGVGKSRFISTVTDKEVLVDNGPLDSDSEIREYSFLMKDIASVYELHLIDVPSFGDDPVKNAEIWTQFILLFNLLEVCERNLVSVIFMHDFEDVSIDEAILADNIQILDTILGDDNRRKCMLVPSLSTSRVAHFAQMSSARELALLSNPLLFGRMHSAQNGSRLSRFDGSRRSALRIVSTILGVRFLPDVTAEVLGIDGVPMSIGESRAGKVILRVLEQAAKRYEKRAIDLDRMHSIMALLQQSPERQATHNMAQELGRVQAEQQRNRLHRRNVSKGVRFGGITTIIMLPLIGIPLGLGWMTMRDTKVLDKDRTERMKIETLALDVLNENRKQIHKQRGRTSGETKNGKSPLKLLHPDDWSGENMYDSSGPSTSSNRVASATNGQGHGLDSCQGDETDAYNRRWSNEEGSSTANISTAAATSQPRTSLGAAQLEFPPSYEEAIRDEQSPRYNQSPFAN